MQLNNILKHVRWGIELDSPIENDRNGNPITYLYGRVAVKVDDLRVQIRSISGPDLPAKLLFPVLNAALPEGWIEAAETAHRSRSCPWCVYVYRGMSGCENYELYSLQSAEFMNQKLSASIHVSMYGKLNQGLNCWLGDLPPLLARLVEKYPPPPEDQLSLRDYAPESRGEYAEAGKNSGLQEALDALKVVEVLSE